MFGVCICAKAGRVARPVTTQVASHVVPASSAAVAAVPSRLIGCSFSLQYSIANRDAKRICLRPDLEFLHQKPQFVASNREAASEVIGPAGFLRLQPILPDWAAFGAAH